MIVNKNNLTELFQEMPADIDLTNKKNVYILSQNSSVYLKCCECKNESKNFEAISFGFNFSNIFIDQSNTYDTKYQNILASKSAAYITKNCTIQRINSADYIVNNIQIGSLYNYDNNITEITLQNLLNQNIDSKQQSLYIDPTLDFSSKKDFNNSRSYNFQNKQGYVHRDKLGDGVNYINNNNFLKMSAHYITNKRFGYWSSIYKGFLTNNNSVICNTTKQLNLLLKRIPRNLNSYTFEIICNINNTCELNTTIEKFFNGTLKIKNCKIISNTEIKDNDCLLVFENVIKGNIIKLENNKKIQFSFSYDSLQNNLFTSINSNLYINNMNENSFKLFDQFSFGNKVVFYNQLNKNSLEFLKNDLNGNMYYIQNKKSNIASQYPGLVNHSHKNLYQNLIDESKYSDITINEVNMLNKRFASDIGSIVGWPKDLPIPFGYYQCSGQDVYIQSENNNDLYYNGSLPFILKNKVTGENKINIPWLPALSGNNDNMIFIMKYNNNFNHR